MTKKLLIYFAIISTFGITACQKKVEGCMHPRAINFNPEADEVGNAVCDYYELELQMQHYAASMADDTLRTYHTLYDADGQPFFLTNMPILASGLHLFKTGSSEELISPESILLTDHSGLTLLAEDNFFITKPEVYTYNITGWNELGTYDRLRFYIGVPPDVRATSPAAVEEPSHPLSTTSIFYMFDSTEYQYRSCRLAMEQSSTATVRKFSLFDYILVDLPCNVTVVDGKNAPIRLRLDYEALFNGISFTNDNDSVVKAKMGQNFAGAFSTY